MRRVEAAEDPFADLPGVGLFGTPAQGRDAAVADGNRAVRLWTRFWARTMSGGLLVARGMSLWGPGASPGQRLT